MPMWAHYANNHQGFCIRYKIEECNGINKGDKIFPVLYTDSRIEGHSIVSAWLNEILYANKNKLPPKESSLKYISYMYLVNCAKHSSWEYEKEFRILFSKQEASDLKGKNVECSVCGIRADKIIAGYACKKEHILRLNNIVQVLKIEPLMKMRTFNNEKFEKVNL